MENYMNQNVISEKFREFLQNSRRQLFSRFIEIFIYQKFGEPSLRHGGPSPRPRLTAVHQFH
jgi:hypothetical protein